MTTPITRRGSLKALGAATVFAPALVRHATAQAPLPPLPNLSANDALLLQPGQPGYDTYEPAANERVLLQPQLRALCKTANAVSVMVNWCRTNSLPFALRSGGHSYEGFSQSASVVIDTRMMNQIAFDRTAQTITVGAGATLGPIYETIGAAGFGFPGGSCPTVGVAGHALGGGFGLIARPFGLACDNLQWLELVDPQGNIIQADAQHNPDLFWAARGGGGGTYGAVTRFRFKIFRIPQVVVLSVTWRLPQTRAVKLFQAWQAWAPQAPANITTFLRVGHAAGGLVDLHCAGESVGSVAEFRRELRALTNVAQPVAGPNLEPMSFLDGAKHFFGAPADPTFFKAKSDYITSALTDAGVATLIGQLEATPSVVAICDSYGGAVTSVAGDATAFAHRAGTLFCIQYFSEWPSASETQGELVHIRTLYTAMRPFVSGECYVNYCDLDLTNSAQAYWAANLPRLRQIKAAFDPNNIFRHAQSVLPA
jgi:hypothetical protein